ncbi:MAG: hypothetical protein JXR03_01970 [Cyclobacteriaceae bacterium]
MGDKLEKFILDHRQDFDSLEPSERLWKGIEKDLSHGKRDFSIIWKVAAVLFLCSTIYLTFERQFSGAVMDEEFNLAQQEFYEAERYYFQQISEKKIILTGMQIDEKNADLIEEEGQLDEIYQDLKRQYLGKTTNPILRDALVENLRLRMKILSNQIEVLNEFKDKDHGNEHPEI